MSPSSHPHLRVVPEQPDPTAPDRVPTKFGDLDAETAAQLRAGIESFLTRNEPVLAQARQRMEQAGLALPAPERDAARELESMFNGRLMSSGTEETIEMLLINVAAYTMDQCSRLSDLLGAQPGPLPAFLADTRKSLDRLYADGMETLWHAGHGTWKKWLEWLKTTAR